MMLREVLERATFVAIAIALLGLVLLVGVGLAVGSALDMPV